jgi:subtilisin family serine protease
MKISALSTFAPALMVVGLISPAPAIAAGYLVEGGARLPANLGALVAAAGGTLVTVHDEIGIATAVSDAPDFAARLAAGSQEIVAATADATLRWAPGRETLAADPAHPSSPLAMSLAASATPAGPTSAYFFQCQWNLRTIDAPGAWSQGQLGAPGAEVAVLDSGVDPYHIDLAGKVDIGRSASFVSPGSSPCGAFDEDTFFDLAFHGTFISSLVTSNGLGIAGVAPNATVVAVKVLNCVGDGSFADIIAGLLYAARLPDVKVINMSLTIYAARSGGFGRLAAALDRAVAYATGRGKLVVAAAGNEGADLDHDGDRIAVPAQAPTAVSVYATTNEDRLGDYSNHGRSGTWVGAGGGSFPNLLPPVASCSVLQPELQSFVIGACSSFVCGATNQYVIALGTSASAPLVAGVAVLVDGSRRGALGPERLKAILAQTADDLGAPGVDNLYSHGRVNAAAAVRP